MKGAYRLGELVVRPDLNQVEVAGDSVHAEPILIDLLGLLAVNSPDVVSSETILNSLWADTVVEESTVHRRISQLRQLLGDDARNPIYIATVPKRGYRVIAPVAPDTDGKEQLPDTTPDATNVRAAHPILPWVCVAVAIALLVFAVGMLAYRIESAPAPRVAAERLRIAVLPFDNFSSSTAYAQIGSGFQEDITTRLAQIQGLEVTSRTSTEKYVDNSKSVTEIADELDLTHLLEGSVRVADRRIRVSVQLIDARDDNHVWAQSYDREIMDLFAIQSDIATQVVDRVGQRISRVSEERIMRVPTQNLTAYDLVVRGRAAMDRGTVASLQEAADLMRSALQYDPQLAEAYAGLARALFLQTHLDVLWSDVREEVLRNSRRALELDPGSAVIHANYAQILSVWENQLPLALDHYQQAIALEPNNPFVLLHYGANLSVQQGRSREALQYLERARSLNPFSGETAFYLARALRDLGRRTEAETVVQNTLQHDPDDIDLRGMEIMLLFARGELYQALVRSHQLVEMDPQNLSNLSGMFFPLLMLGEMDAATYWWERMQKIAPTHSLTFDAGMYLALVSNDMGLLKVLRDRWSVQSSKDRTRSYLSGNRVEPGTSLDVFLRYMQAENAAAIGDKKARVAALGAVVEGADGLLRNDAGNLEVSWVNQRVALAQASSLIELGDPVRAQDTLTAILKSADPDDEYEISTVFAASALAGDVDGALALLDAHAARLFSSELMSRIETDPENLFHGLAQHEAYAAFRQSTLVERAALRQRIITSAPEILGMDRYHSL